MNAGILTADRQVAGARARETNALRFLVWTLAAIALIRFLSLGVYPLFDNTEARYAYIGKLMFDTGNWITPMASPGVPFWAKPPLSMWVIAASYSVFGVNEFAARFPFFLMFVAVGWLVYAIAADMMGRLGGVVSAAVFASSGLPVYLAGGVMTDPALTLGTTLTMASFLLRMRDGNKVWGYLFFVGLAIALLAKGPIGAVLPGIAIGVWVLWHNQWREIWNRIPWIIGTLATATVVLPWYIAAEIATPGFLQYFIIGEHFQRFLDPNWRGDMYGAPRNHVLGTIWVFEALAFLPWTPILLFIALKANLRRVAFGGEVLQDKWVRYLVLWMLTPVVFFSATRAVLITYVGMSIPALALLTGYAFNRLGYLMRPWIAAVAMIVPAFLFAAVTFYVLDPATSYLQTQANTLAAFRGVAETNKGKLVYYRFAPHSTRFYGEQDFTEAGNLEALVGQLNAGAKFFAMHSLRYSQLPDDVKVRFEIVAINNATYLLRSKSARPTND